MRCVCALPRARRTGRRPRRWARKCAACTCKGPTGAGGGVNFGARQILAVKSVLIPREWVKPEIVMERAA